jgi:hypothetical protein
MHLHEVLNVLNRLALAPGLDEQSQDGIEHLGRYLAACGRLDVDAAPAEAGERLREHVVAACAMSAWLAGHPPPSVEWPRANGPIERPAAWASRVQQSLKALQGRRIESLQAAWQNSSLAMTVRLAADEAGTPEDAEPPWTGTGRVWTIELHA